MQLEYILHTLLLGKYNVEGGEATVYLVQIILSVVPDTKYLYMPRSEYEIGEWNLIPQSVSVLYASCGYLSSRLFFYVRNFQSNFEYNWFQL